MNILLISASQRDQSNSFKVAQHIKTNIFDDLSEISLSMLDLSKYRNLLDHYGFEINSGFETNSGFEVDNDKQINKEKDEVLSLLYACDAVVFITPEWGGMIPPALVNLLLLTANGSANGLPLGHKPAFAIGVSASGGGSNPISLLKAYAAKNSHLTWLPLHAIVQNVEQFLEHPWSPESKHRFSQVQSRLLVGIQSLVIYAKQLAPIREKLVALSKVHPFGQ